MVLRLSSLLRLSEQLIIYRHVKLHISQLPAPNNLVHNHFRREREQHVVDWPVI
jgi:hypothetical protein